ncbi:MAG: ATP-dependent DNA helicase RecG [Candidatus Limnocylindrus sp.]
MNADPSGLPLKGLGLPGGASLLRGLARLGVHSVGDLLLYLPRRYEDRRAITLVAELVGGSHATVRVRVVDVRVEKTWRRGVQRTIATLADESGVVEAVWYGRRFIERRLHSGAEIVASGRVKAIGWRTQLEAPEFSPLEGGESVNAGRIVPIYRLTKGVTALSLRGAVRQLIDQFGEVLADPLPASVRARHRLMPLAAALTEAHWPSEFDQRDAALRRLAFDELLAVQLSLVRRRRRRIGGSAPAIRLSESDRAAIESTICGGLRGEGGPALTPSWTVDQAAAIDAILTDLAAGEPMLRLLQGDVGTGKTAVALVAAAAAARAGMQCAMLAPTELLARQHAATASKLLTPLGVRVDLLVGSLSTAERRRVRTDAANGSTALLIGTHALFSEATQFAALGLVIVDEQHRFGVEERAQLTAKGEGEPHLLLMTATPIPRTIAQLLYADVASSELRALPAGRRPIRTAIRSGAELDRLWSFIASEAGAGRGTFVVVPRIGDGDPGEEPSGDAAGDALEVAGEVGVLEQAERIAAAAPSLRIGVVHGRQPTATRTDVMERFTRGDLDVIVGTTVVEVGVDVPRASVMVIMSADRFGLATLHQLRGRVGRGGSEGWCVLVSDSEDEVARARLEAIESTRDGFALAERDVELRGEGDVLGTDQSGLPPLRVAALSRAEDRALAVVARGEAEELLDAAGRPTPLSRPLIESYLRGWPTAVLVSREA